MRRLRGQNRAIGWVAADQGRMRQRDAALENERGQTAYNEEKEPYDGASPESVCDHRSEARDGCTPSRNRSHCYCLGTIFTPGAGVS